MCGDREESRGEKGILLRIDGEDHFKELHSHFCPRTFRHCNHNDCDAGDELVEVCLCTRKRGSNLA